MSVKPALGKDSSGQEAKILAITASITSNSNSIRSPLLAKTSSDIVDFFNGREQDLRNRQ